MNEPAETTENLEVEQPDSWEQLEQIVAAKDSEAARSYLKELPPGEDARIMAQLTETEQQEFIALLNDEDAAHLMESLPELQAGQLLSALPPEKAALIFDEMHSDEQVDLLDQLTEAQSEAIIEQMDPEEAENVRFLAQYDSQSAGGLMITELLSFEESQTVDDVVTELRQNAEEYATYNVQYIYVINAEEQLVGVLRLRDLLMAPPGRRLNKMMIANPTSVPDSTSLQDLQHFFDSHHLFGLPVIDADQKLVGVVRREDVEQAGEEQAGRTFLRFAGIMGGEELRSLPLKIRSARRLSWLSINIVLNIVAASIIAMYEETLETVIALAVFLPIVSDMSGCSGNQSIAVSTRELVLGVIRPRDWFHVFRKELGLGLVNGITLGILLGGVAYLWKGNPYLGLVIGGALGLNTLMAVCLGALIPLILKGFKLDPALASGPILTTLTDMCGFFLVLSFAQALLPWLT
ncbi:Magnesium transporter MgtE [Gimesia alba]|uniref:Magnesium transporter MgtE n=1 Tax=Gimesia alba TaxID=2527973 RepID=A0A517RL85_9PLAN|nr:magnesium transporter [Gimesia alba]QDT44644.1 Magnesium transporter MgtE [Gimesia alba]